MWLGSLREFSFSSPFCQLYSICRVDAEKDDQDFRLLDSAIYSFEAIMSPMAVISCVVLCATPLSRLGPKSITETMRFARVW